MLAYWLMTSLESLNNTKNGGLIPCDIVHYQESYSDRIFIDVLLVILYNHIDTCSLEVTRAISEYSLCHLIPQLQTTYARLWFPFTMRWFALSTLGYKIYHNLCLDSYMWVELSVIFSKFNRYVGEPIGDLWSSKNILQLVRSQNNDGMRSKQCLSYPTVTPCANTKLSSIEYFPWAPVKTWLT